MDHALPMNVVERLADGERDPQAAPHGEPALIGHHLAKQSPFNPFHDHIQPAAIAIVERFDGTGMVEFPANQNLPLKAVEKDRVALGFGMRHLDGDRAAIAHVDGAEDGCHAAAGHLAFNPIAIDLVSGADWGHGASSCDHIRDLLNKA